MKEARVARLVVVPIRSDKPTAEERVIPQTSKK